MSTKTSPRPLSELDILSRQRIEHLCGLEPHELSLDDKHFMWGRRDYLTAEQVADYAEQPVVADDEAGDSYYTWSLDELKAECLARGLEVTGRAKAPYAAALVADDEAGE